MSETDSSNMTACVHGRIPYNCIRCAQEKVRKQDATIAELRGENKRLRAEKLDILRGNFTQVCSYCGFEAQPPNGWDELQKHIVECTEHPLTALRTRAEASEAKVEEAIERCNAAIEQVDCEASFDEFANIKQILEDK